MSTDLLMRTFKVPWHMGIDIARFRGDQTVKVVFNISRGFGKEAYIKTIKDISKVEASR